MKNIQAALLPLTITMFLCGFAVFPFHYSQSCLKFYINNCYVFYILISWLVFVCIVLKTRTFLLNHQLDFPTIIFPAIFFAMLSLPISIYFNKKFNNCLVKLHVLNNTLEKLGISNNYAKLRIQTTGLVIGWIVLRLVTDSTDGLWYLKHFHTFTKAIILPFIINHAGHINMLYDFVYMLLLSYVKSQFERINKYIQELKEQSKEEKVKYAWTISTSPSIHQDITNKETREEKIWILM
ncbi:hypothetical protein PUN28_015092 [Cardiocondyla obscurior]